MTWCTFYRGFFTLVVAFIVMQYLFGSIQYKSWDSMFSSGSTQNNYTNGFYNFRNFDINSASHIDTTLTSLASAKVPNANAILTNGPTNRQKLNVSGGNVSKFVENAQSAAAIVRNRNVLHKVGAQLTTTNASTNTVHNNNNYDHNGSISNNATDLSATAGNSSQSEFSPVLPLCPDTPPNLVHNLKVEKSHPAKINELLARFSWLLPGGHWHPQHCRVPKKVAIIVPFRRRAEHLLLFLQHMHPFLRKQQLDYRIFVIEQEDDGPFNRAMLMNVGYVEALKVDASIDCFIFHDVDLLPEDERNLYTCPHMPRHMSVAVDVFQYSLPYRDIFGGVSAITKEHFQLLNGFSNSFWGWGGEDDDMSSRIRFHNLVITRYPKSIARYSMLTHKKEKANPHRYEALKRGKLKYRTDGLNSLHYTVSKFRENLLYTWFLVNIKPNR